MDKKYLVKICGSRKYPYPPHRRSFKKSKEAGVLKEKKPKFLKGSMKQGWEDQIQTKNVPWKGYAYIKFSGTTY